MLIGAFHSHSLAGTRKHFKKRLQEKQRLGTTVIPLVIRTLIRRNSISPFATFLVDIWVGEFCYYVRGGSNLRCFFICFKIQSVYVLAFEQHFKTCTTSLCFPMQIILHSSMVFFFLMLNGVIIIKLLTKAFNFPVFTNLT